MYLTHWHSGQKWSAPINTLQQEIEHIRKTLLACNFSPQAFNSLLTKLNHRHDIHNTYTVSSLFMSIWHITPSYFAKMINETLKVLDFCFTYLRQHYYLPQDTKNSTSFTFNKFNNLITPVFPGNRDTYSCESRCPN